MHILDTGPIFKFLTTDCVPELLLALGHNKVHVPAAVEFEVLNTPTRHTQFEQSHHRRNEPIGNAHPAHTV